MNSVLEEDIRRRKMMWSWSHIVQHRRTMRQYREAYVKKLDGKKVSKELQKTLTVSCHRFYSIWGGEGGVGLCLYPLYSVKRRILFDSVTVFLLFAFCRWRWLGKRIMMFNNTFYNNISVISWRSVLLVEKTWVPGENHRPVTSYWQIYHIMLYRVHFCLNWIELTTSVVIGA